MHKTDFRKSLRGLPDMLKQNPLEAKYLLKNLYGLIEREQPACIGLYAATEHEVDLSEIFKRCKKMGIITAYPRLSNEEISFHSVDSQADLSPTLPYGICEPAATAALVQPDWLVVPGLAFTKDGKRLGRGKGHYDRYLAQHRPHTVSLAFSWQLYDDLPTEPHDVMIDQVIYKQID